MQAKRLYLVIAGALSFLIALISQMPAADVYGWTLGRSPQADIALRGISGRAVSGHAVQLVAHGKPVANDLRWQFRPLRLLLGSLAFHISASQSPLLFDGEVAAGFGGLTAQDLKGNGDLRQTAAVFGQTFVPFSGAIGLQLEKLQLKHQVPVYASGQLQLIGLAWTLAGQPIALGDYSAQVRTEDGDIIALISTNKGLLDVNGDARLKPDHSYEFSVQLRPRPEAPQTLVNLLRTLGNPDAQGYYRLQRKGRLLFPGAPP